MILYTLQVAKWRLAKEKNKQFLDTSVKTGNKLFAPTWDLLMGYKEGKISEEEYTTRFYALMRESFSNNREEWMKVLGTQELVIGCYCANGHFCHRYLLADIFKKQCNHFNKAFVYLGELE